VTDTLIELSEDSPVELHDLESMSSLRRGTFRSKVHSSPWR
jgi:hypothetical protein